MEIKREINGNTSIKIGSNKILRYDPATDCYSIILLPLSHNRPPTSIGPISSEMIKLLYNSAWEAKNK